MTKINLLDWRAERRTRRLELFRSRLVLGFAAAAAVVGLGWFAVSNAISGQQGRNEYLRQQIAEIDQKIKEIEDLERTKQNLLARMRVIEELQGSRSATVHFFDELVNTIPDGIGRHHHHRGHRRVQRAHLELHQELRELALVRRAQARGHQDQREKQAA